VLHGDQRTEQVDRASPDDDAAAERPGRNDLGLHRAFYSGKHQRHGMNVQLLADPAGRLVWASPTLPGSRHDLGAAREHGLIDGLNDAGIRVVADTAYQGAGPGDPGPAASAPPRLGHRPLPAAVTELEGGQRRALSPARSGERANAQLKSWKILRRIRCCLGRARSLVKAVAVLIRTG
jgi:hypothetical protein